MNISRVIIGVPIFMFGLVFHEYAHAYMAYRFGDHTAKYQGRLTLNPLAHISLWGTIILPIITMLIGGIMLAWAKPVPIDFREIPSKKLRQAIILIALAGPLMNIIIALLSIILYAVIATKIPTSFYFYRSSLILLSLSIQANTILAVFNLIPIPPLDGSRVLSAILPYKSAIIYNSIERYSLVIMILLIYTGILDLIFHPSFLMIDHLVNVFLRLFS